MLVLSRKKNESIVINNDITVTVVEIRGDKVRLGIVAYYRGNFVTARDHLAEALALCARGRHELRDTAIAPDPHVAAAYLGVALVHLGDTAQAIAHGEAAVEGARRFGSSSPAYALALSVLPRTLEVLRDAAGGVYSEPATVESGE